VHTRVAETGRDRHRLFVLTGLEVTENQARRLLNDVVSYRGYLEQKEGRPVPETVAAHRRRAEVYDRVMAMVPADLVDRLAPAEVFHEILEHRWFLSEQAGTDVGTTTAAQAYIAHPPADHQHADRAARAAGLTVTRRGRRAPCPTPGSGCCRS
jgi:hypothetical protein